MRENWSRENFSNNFVLYFITYTYQPSRETSVVALQVIRFDDKCENAIILFFCCLFYCLFHRLSYVSRISYLLTIKWKINVIYSINSHLWNVLYGTASPRKIIITCNTDLKFNASKLNYITIYNQISRTEFQIIFRMTQRYKENNLVQTRILFNFIIRRKCYQVVYSLLLIYYYGVSTVLFSVLYSEK